MWRFRRSIVHVQSGCLKKNRILDGKIITPAQEDKLNVWKQVRAFKATASSSIYVEKEIFQICRLGFDFEGVKDFVIQRVTHYC